MMQLEASPTDRVCVIGPLTGAALKTLFEMVKTTEVLLDLSQVSEADAEALQAAGAAGTGAVRSVRLSEVARASHRDGAPVPAERGSRMNGRLRAARRLSTVLALAGALRSEIRFVNQFRSRVSLAGGGAASPARGRP